jgi:hypothetical protein
MRIIRVDRDRRAGKPAREHLMFDVVQVKSYLHRHGALSVNPQIKSAIEVPARLSPR